MAFFTTAVTGVNCE